MFPTELCYYELSCVMQARFQCKKKNRFTETDVVWRVATYIWLFLAHVHKGVRPYTLVWGPFQYFFVKKKNKAEAKCQNSKWLLSYWRKTNDFLLLLSQLIQKDVYFSFLSVFSLLYNMFIEMNIILRLLNWFFCKMIQ